MDTTNTYKGFWWQPSDPDRRFFGELILNENVYPTLTIYDDTDYSEESFPTFSEVAIFHGGSQSSISLLNCVSSGSSTVISHDVGHCATTFVIYGPVLMGLLIDSIEEEIEGFQIQINNDNWIADVGGIKGRRISKGTISTAIFETPLPISVEFLYKGENLTIQYRINISDKNSMGFYQVSHNPAFLLMFSEPKPLKEYIKILRLFERYLSLISGEIVRVELLKTKSEKSKFPLDIYNISFNKVYNRRIWKPSKIKRNILTDVFKNAPETLGRWFDRYAEIETTINLFFNTIMYELEEESTYIILCQALEDYYRIRWDKGAIMDNKTYRSNRKELEEIINLKFQGDDLEQFRDIVIEKLRYANQRRLVDMIEDLLKQIAPLSISSVVLAGYTVKDLANLIKNTRNDLTHRGDAESVKIAQESLPDLIPRVQHLIGSHLLLELGLSSEQIQRWFA